jgi:hypothetical protein
MNTPTQPMNPIDTHTDAGTRAGKAAARRDMATVRHFQQWHHRAAAMEKEPHRTAALEAYRNAYRAAAHEARRNACRATGL